MPHLSETNYHFARNAPRMLLFDQDGKTTQILSEVLVRQDVRKPLDKSSVTRINAPESRTVVDGFTSKSLITCAESDAEFDANSAFNESSDPSAPVNRDRLIFLARKYARLYSKEEDARLEILTEKVRAMLPRVTKGDFQRVAKIANELSSIHEENQKLRDKLKLD